MAVEEESTVPGTLLLLPRGLFLAAVVTVIPKQPSAAPANLNTHSSRDTKSCLSAFYF